MRSTFSRSTFVVCGLTVAAAGCQHPDVHPFWHRFAKATPVETSTDIPPGPAISAPAGYAMAPGYTLPQAAAPGAYPQQGSPYAAGSSYNSQQAQGYAGYGSNPNPPSANGAYNGWPNQSASAAPPADGSQWGASAPPSGVAPAAYTQPQAPTGYNQSAYGQAGYAAPAQNPGAYPTYTPMASDPNAAGITR